MIMIYGILFTITMGILLRNIYPWSDQNPFIAVLAPVDFSVFQRLKLLFSPYMLWTLVEYAHFGQFSKNFIPVKGVALFAGMVIMAILSILLMKALRKRILWIDLTVLVVSVLIAFGLDYLLSTCTLTFPLGGNLFGSLLFFLSALAMWLFTFYPPYHPFFTNMTPSCRKSCK